MPEHGNPSVRRRWLAAELRRLRERAGVTGEEVAEHLGWSGSKLSRIETSKIGVKQADLQLLLDLYGVDETHRAEVIALARESAKTSAPIDSAAIASFPRGHAAYVYAEFEAIRIWNWEPQVVPGLLQTEGYAREVMRDWFSMFKLPPTDLEIRVRARMMRQQVLARDRLLEFSAVIDESVIYRRFGNNSVMHQQLEHLAGSLGMPNVEVRILPLSGRHPIGTGSFYFMQFPQEHEVPARDLVTIEDLLSDYNIEDVMKTNQYRVTFEYLRSVALDPTASHDLIVKTAREIWS